MNHWLNYHHLYYFKTIAQEGSISNASKKLLLGQPALSAQLKQFEENIGVKLFERAHRKLILTESGKIALEYANDIFKTGSEMVQVLQDRITPSRIHVQFGALDSIPKHIIAQLVESAFKITKCSITILEGKEDELLRELNAHTIDLILTNHLNASHINTRVYSRSIAKVPVIICGSKRFLPLKKNFPKSINRQPMILPTYHSRLRTELEHYFKLNSLDIDVVAETQDTSLQKILGSDGIGLVALSEVAAEQMIKQEEIFKIGKLNNVYEEIYLISGERKIKNPISDHLFKTFKLC